MKIVSLLENTASSEKVKAEHGLSLYIETDCHKILFDMGQSDLFYENALSLGIDLTLVDIAVLSHGHYDHGGGLGKFLEVNKTAPVYINKNAFEPHYNGTEKYIGLDKALENNPRIIFTDNEFSIDKSLTLFTCNERERKFTLLPSGLNTFENGEFIPDDFRHEQYLLIEEQNKNILISGCSHKGICDITDWFGADVLIGGFHLSKYPLDDELTRIANKLDLSGTQFYTCHCTGIEQYNFMKNHMKKLSYLSCGETILF